MAVGVDGEARARQNSADTWAGWETLQRGGSLNPKLAPYQAGRCREVIKPKPPEEAVSALRAPVTMVGADGGAQ